MKAASRQSFFVGDRFQNNMGLWFEVIEYITGKKIKVKFDNSGYSRVVEGQEIRRKSIVDAFTKYPVEGSTYETNHSGTVKVLEYKHSRHVLVEFVNTGHKVVTEACQLVRGTVRDDTVPHTGLGGVGYLGVGRYKTQDSDGKSTWHYSKWLGMMNRCYNPHNEITAHTYRGVTVCKEWHNFQIFSEWANKQIGYGNRTWALEKDLLVKGNKVYGPDACCFLPQDLNNFILKAEGARGEYPIGVSLQKDVGNFVAHCSGTGESGYAGVYATPEAAFSAYKKVKEATAKEKANKWKDKIDPRAYNALMRYEVFITD